MSRCGALVGVLLALALEVGPAAAPAGAEPPAAGAAPAVAYRPPVPGGVRRPYSPPASPYGPGHRGVDLAAAPGTTVRAAAAGLVVHAGRVAGTAWVSIDHADGVRTAYGPLAALRVATGDRVAAGQALGRLAPGGHGRGGRDRGLHLSARRDGAYLDPLLLLTGRPALRGPTRSRPGADGGWTASEEDRYARPTAHRSGGPLVTSRVPTPITHARRRAAPVLRALHGVGRSPGRAHRPPDPGAATTTGPG